MGLLIYISGMEHVGGDMYQKIPEGDAILMKVNHIFIYQSHACIITWIISLMSTQHGATKQVTCKFIFQFYSGCFIILMMRIA